MTTLLKSAFQRFENLSQERQNEIASFLLQIDPNDFHISHAEKEEWSSIISGEKSQKYLDAIANKILTDTNPDNIIDADPSRFS